MDETKFMKIGYQILIQDSLTAEQKVKAKEYADNFIKTTNADPKKRYFGVTGGGYTTGLWRGRLGLKAGEGLWFRRISKNLRKFGIVAQDTMEVYNDKPLHKNDDQNVKPNGPIPNTWCCCPQCKGSLRVRFVNKPKMTVYYQTGEIKG